MSTATLNTLSQQYKAFTTSPTGRVSTLSLTEVRKLVKTAVSDDGGIDQFERASLSRMLTTAKIGTTARAEFVRLLATTPAPKPPAPTTADLLSQALTALRPPTAANLDALPRGSWSVPLQPTGGTVQVRKNDDSSVQLYLLGAWRTVSNGQVSAARDVGASREQWSGRLSFSDGQLLLSGSAKTQSYSYDPWYKGDLVATEEHEQFGFASVDGRPSPPTQTFSLVGHFAGQTQNELLHAHVNAAAGRAYLTLPPSFGFHEMALLPGITTHQSTATRTLAATWSQGILHLASTTTVGGISSTQHFYAKP